MVTIVNTLLAVASLCVLAGASQECALDFLVLKGDIVGMFNLKQPYSNPNPDPDSASILTLFLTVIPFFCLFLF